VSLNFLLPLGAFLIRFNVRYFKWIVSITPLFNQPFSQSK